MSSCCDPVRPTAPSSAKSALTIALAGNPNSGKTTIFNALTGLRQKVANYPGVTVEKKVGRCWLKQLPGLNSGAEGSWVEIIDLPGTYSLISRSPDEQVAMEVLRGISPGTPAPDLVIVVVDASNLQRNLYLVSQLIELGRPLIVALNMMDVAERRGLHVSPQRLEKELGVSVIPLVGHKREGIDALKDAIAHARVAPLPDFELPEAMKMELMSVGRGLAQIDSSSANAHEKPSVSLDESASAPRAWICRADSDRRIDRYEALAERLIIGDFAGDVTDIAKREPVASLLSGAHQRLSQLGIDPMQADIEAHYRWIEQVATRSAATLEELASMGAPAPQTLEYQAKTQHLSDKVDAIFMHRIWGFVVFGAIMAALFVSIFVFADPLMTAVESSIGWLGDIVAPVLPDGPIRDLWTDGIVAGVGGVVVFVPQIAILFLFLAILEDTGYLARAAFLMDRAFAKVGLHGKSFIPMLSSFACAIPGIMATRTIENRKDRLATIFVAPFMSCSARLPVYTLLIGTFFATFSAAARGGIMLGCYALGILAAAGTAWIFKRSFLKGPTPAFILEMPSYKVPQLSQVVRSVVVNTGAFLKKAGTIIFCLSVILWALSYYPRLPASTADAVASTVKPSISTLDTAMDRRGIYGSDDSIWWFNIGREDLVAQRSTGAIVQGELTESEQKRFDEALDAERQKAVAAEQLRYSFAGRFGHLVEPVIKPLGFDWKMGVGLVGAFAAREVFVSTMGIVYSAGDSEDDTSSLESAMVSDTYPDGRPVWTPLVAISLLIWFVLAMQCMSTLAIVRRETGGWKWPLGMLLYMNALAYVVCLGVYQIGRIWWT
jgi:ferrous iron transport protein B